MFDFLPATGRSRKQKVELDRSWVLERLTVNGKEYVYQQVGGLKPGLSSVVLP